MSSKKTSKTPLPTTPELADARVAEGGELHQQAGGDHAALTTNQGLVISDNQNSLKAHPRGPTLLEDFILREKITHFDHERIPERIVHARGTGAHGYFELTASLADVTTAQVLTQVGVRTPVFTRFSTVAGGAGSADTPRDVRGFSVKMYTQQGNWDLVGNNIPVFFIQDAIKFPDLIHAVKMELSLHQRRRQVDLCEVSLATEAGFAIHAVGQSREDRGGRQRLPSPRHV